MFVQCHIEETDQFGNPITTQSTLAAHLKRNVAKEFKMNDEKDEDEEEEEEEENMEEEEEEKPKAT